MMLLMSIESTSGTRSVLASVQELRERYHDTMVALGRLFGIWYRNDIVVYIKAVQLGAPSGF